VTVGSVLAMAAHLEGKCTSVIDMTGLAQKNGAVWSHLRISNSPASATGFTSPSAAREVARSAGEGLIGARVGLAEADLLLGCDLVTSAEKDSIFTLDRERSRAVINSWLQPTAHFQLDPSLTLDREAELRPLRAGVAPERLHALDATSLARDLLGNTIGANFLLVGFALQAGGLPLSRAAIERAIELNGQAVEFNKRALALGRLAAHDPESLARLHEAASPSSTARSPAAQTLEELTQRRVECLTDYQDQAYANRYAALVERVRDTERERTRGLHGLAEAVARNYFKLLAYKDEYEVGRLHSSPEFLQRLEQAFEGERQLRFHLAPPLLSRPDPRTGQVRKREFGPWVLHLFRALARLKRLRGTAFDPFGWLPDRKLERQLIADYERLVDELLVRLAPDNHAVAIELAALPEQVRGFGHVKRRQLDAARRREAELLDRLRAEVAAVPAVAA
jgi:indolepyruvate ferredoxin oxidoreductase